MQTKCSSAFVNDSKHPDDLNMGGQGNFSIKFWGVRGSVPCPGPTTVRYGGNTTCIEINCGSHLLIIDAGSGIRELGMDLNKRGGIVDADIFFTHTHLDHIIGFPFFGPFYNPQNSFNLTAGNLEPPHDLENVLKNMIIHDPVFPVPASVILGSCAFKDFNSGEELNPRQDVIIKTGPLNHPNGACGYRVEYQNHAVAVITDTEHPEEGMDDNVLQLVQDADVMVYDAAYTEEEYPKFKGWGHSTWQMAVKIAEAANVKKTILFHHDPTHDDDRMDEIAKEAAAVRFGTEPAYEGMEIKVC